MTNVETRSTHAELLGLLTGCWISQALCVAARLGIADLLGDGSKSCANLAEATKTHAGALYRMLRALSSIGVFEEEEGKCFRLTALAGHLRKGTPGSLHAFAILLGEPEHWRSWEGMLHSVQTGEPAFDQVFGEPLFQYLAKHPRAAEIFDAAMTSRSSEENTQTVSAYKFLNSDIVVDVGGGHGSLMSSLLQRHGSARGIVVDLPHVIARSRARVKGAVWAARCEFREGDFFSAVPPGGTVYVLKRVIHDWDDERAVTILANCRRAMSASARLLLIEPIIPPGNGPSFSKLLDLLMLAWHSGGRERTENEHRTLLARAGLRVNRIVPMQSGVALIEAVT